MSEQPSGMQACPHFSRIGGGVPAANIVLEARNLGREYRVPGGLLRPAFTIKALAGVSFVLQAGRTLAVVGESGCGKSTLARLVTMIERPTAGSLLIAGIDVGAADRPALRRLRSQVQIVFQDPYSSLNPRQRIGAILEEPLIINAPSMPAGARREAALDMMDKVGLGPDHYHRYPHMLSGGQRQRIAIARALMLRPRILVLDEPVPALDLSVQAQILNILAELQEAFGLAYLFISHDLSVVRHMADEVMVMYLGCPVEHGARDRIFAAPSHPYTRALLRSLAGQPARAQVEGVNRFMNRLPYIEDSVNWGVNDYWATPLEFLSRGGDCEDFAIIKFYSLLELGFDNDQMRVVVLEDTLRRLPHAVLAVRIDGTEYILDNNFSVVLTDDRLPQYVPQYSLNLNTRWLHITPDALGRVSG